MSNRKPAPNRAGKTVALTGSSGLIGSHLLRALVKEKRISKVIVIDKVKPHINSSKILFLKTDITDAEMVEHLGKALKKCAALVHCSLQESPSVKRDESHEIQVTGTHHVLLACEAADISKIILASTTEVYGALPDNPSFLTEEHKQRGSSHGPFLKDKIDAEKQFLRFQKRFPKKVVTILRPCTILGPNIDDFKSGFLRQPVVPTVLGFDPLIQFIHITDLVRALILSIKKNFGGIFNIAGDGVFPLSRALKLEGKTKLPISSVFLYPAASLLWHLNIGLAPAEHIDFLKYSFVADATKAKKVMGFRPIFSSREALLDKAFKEAHEKEEQ